MTPLPVEDAFEYQQSLRAAIEKGGRRTGDTFTGKGTFGVSGGDTRLGASESEILFYPTFAAKSGIKVCSKQIS